MNGKPTKTREELAAAIWERIKDYPAECHAVTGVVIAPIVRTDASRPNWHAAFTVKGWSRIPRIAWRIGSEVAAEFDLE